MSICTDSFTKHSRILQIESQCLHSYSFTTHRFALWNRPQTPGISPPLPVTTSERDLGVYVFDNQKPSLQCQKATAKALRILSVIKRTFKNLDITLLRKICKTFVRPHLGCRILMSCLDTLPCERHWDFRKGTKTHDQDSVRISDPFLSR